MKSAFLLAGCCLCQSCYDSGGKPEGTAPAPWQDGNGDGVPDAVGPDPVLDDLWNDDRPDDHDHDGRPDEEDVDDDNDLILDDAPDAALVAAIRPIARAECESVAACCPQGWGDSAVERCAVVAAGHLVVGLAQSWADGLLAVHPDALDSCVAAQAFDCSAAEQRRAPWECSSYLEGLQVERAACGREAECASDHYCSGDLTYFEGTFLTGPGPYEVRFWEAAPDPGSVCLPDGGPGQACGPQVGTCGVDLQCQSSDAGDLCVTPASEGEACSIAGSIERGDDCAAGLFCDEAEEQPMFCVEKRSGGEECGENRECRSGKCDPRELACTAAPPPSGYCAEGASYL